MVTFAPTKPNADIHDILSPSLAGNQTWADMADVFGQVMFSNVEDPISQLENIRSISQKSDTEVLQLTARLLGFDVSQDVLNLNAENLTKIVSQLSHYPDQNGTETFYKFIDLVLNANTDVIVLHTQDYVNFVRPLASPATGKLDLSPGQRLIDGGRFFRTTHIELRLDIPKAASLNLGVGQTLFERVHELFYNFAPTTLVIDYTVFVVRFGSGTWMNNKNETVSDAFGVTTTMVYGDVHVTLE